MAVLGDDVRVEGLTFSSSSTAVVIDVLGTDANPVERLSVVCNVIEGSGANLGVWAIQTASVVSELVVERNVLRDMHGGAYVNPGALSVEFRDNVFDRMSTGAISFEAEGSVRIIRNTFRNGADGVWIHRAHSGTVVRANVFSGNSGEALDYDPVAPEPALDARQNWWGSPNGPRTAADAPPLEGDDGTGQADGAQDYAARQVIDGHITTDPWCRQDGCPHAPVVISGKVLGASPEGAIVTATWDGGSASSAAVDGDGNYRIDVAVPWEPIQPTQVALKATKDDLEGVAGVDVSPENNVVVQDLALDVGGESGSGSASSISAKPSTVGADGESAATISVTVRTASGALRTQNTDRVEIATTFGTLSPGAWSAVDPGVWEATLKSTRPGSAEVFAFVEDEEVPGSPTVTFVPGAPSGNRSTVSSGTDSLTADGVSPTEITVTVRDAAGNARAAGGDLVRLSLSTKADGTPNGTLGPVIDNGDGTYTAEYRSSTVTGTAVVSAHVRETLVTEEVTLTQVATIELAPGEANALRSTLTADPPSAAPADGITAVPVRVQLKDAHGNNRTRGESELADVVTFTTDFVRPDGPDGQPETEQATHTVEADTAGVAVLHVTSDETGYMTVRAAHDDVPVPNAVTVTFGDVPPPATRAQSQITVNKAQRLANGQSAATITLTAKDADGNVVAGEPVTLDVTSGAGRFAGGSTSVPGTTGANGTFTATLTSTEVGLTTVGGSVRAGAVGADEAPASVTVDFRELSSPATSTLTASSSEGTAGSGPVTITFQAKDAGGNTRGDVEGETVRFQTSRGTISPTETVTGANGAVTATLTAPLAEDHGVATVTAYLNGDEDPIASTATVTFHPPAVPANTDITKNRTYVAADGVRTATITLDLKDASGDPRRLGSDNVTPVVEGPHVSVKDKRYVGDGRWQFEVHSQVVRENSPVTATVNGTAIGKSVMVTFEPPTSALRSGLARVGTGGVRANGTDTVTLRVEAKNAAGAARRAGGDTVTLTVNGIGPTRTLVPTYVGDEITGSTPGVYEVALSSSVDGTATVTGHINGEAIYDGGTSPKPVTIVFSPVADASRSVVSVATSSEAHNRLANGSDSTTIRAQLNTASGGAMTAGGDKVRLSTTRGFFSETGSAMREATTDGSGRVTGTLKSNEPGPATITAFLVTDVDDDGEEELVEFGTPATVTFHPLASTQHTQVTATPDTVVANDTATATITVRAKDSTGADRTTGREAITLTHDGGADVVLATTLTDHGNGTYSTNIRSKSAKTVTVTAKIGTETVVDDAVIDFVAKGAAAQSTTTVLNDFVAANNTNVAQVRVQVKNAAGDDQSAPGDSVAVTSAPGVTATTPTYLGDGLYGFSVRSATPAPTRLAVKVNGEDLAVEQWPTITFEPETAPAKTTLSASPSTVLAGSEESAEIIVQARNAADANRKGTEDTVTLSVSGPAQFDNYHQTVIAQPMSDGRYRAYLKGVGAGSATVTGKVNGVDITGGNPAGQVTVTVHGPTSAAHSLISTTDTDKEVVVGGAPALIQVEPRTAAGQMRQSGGDSVILTTDRGSFAQPLDGDSRRTVATYNTTSDRYEATLHSSNEAGIATITGVITPAGSQTATAIGQPEGGLQIEFVPDVPWAGTSQVTAAPERITADGVSTSTITVQLKDRHGNDVTDSSGMTLTMTYGSGSLGPITNNNDGTYTATLTSAEEPGTTTIRAKLSTTSFFTDTATVVMEAATSKEHTTITAVPTTVYANTTDTSTITVQAMANGTTPRTIGGDTIMLTTDHGTFSNGSTSVEAVYTDSGRYTATFVAPPVAGTATVRGTVNGQQITDTAVITVEASAPTAPTSVATQDSDGQATVSWKAPSSHGGDPAVTYRVYRDEVLAYTTTATDGPDTDGVWSRLFAGLANGTTYTFAVEAVNSKGASPQATATAAPFGAPLAPTAVTKHVAAGEIKISWAAANGNGRPVTGYTVTAAQVEPAPPAGTEPIQCTPAAGTLECVFQALAKGTTYDFSVVAHNSETVRTTSPPSEKVREQFLLAPSAPVLSGAEPGDGQVRLTWSLADTGGAPVTYTVRATPVSGPAVTRLTESAALTYTFDGLENDKAYTFEVQAVHRHASPWSNELVATPKAPRQVVTQPPGNTQPEPTTSASPSPSPSPTPTTSPAPAPLPGPGPIRINGQDRASTAAAVSASHFDPGVPAVYVATSSNFADALAGGPAAAHDGGPVLLVERDRVPESTFFELERLAPERVIVLGGTGAVSELVVEQLDEHAPVQRLSGTDRFATAAAVSRATFPERVSVAYIATGSGFADALSGGAAAARNRGPVLLVGGDGIPDSTAEELRRLSPRQIVVLGGSGAIPSEVAAELDAYTDGEVERISGPDRYATSAAIAERMFPVAVDTVFVATGENFPDALAGVPAAAREKAPLLLVRPDAVPDAVAQQLKRLRPRRIVILGGSGAVDEDTERALSAFTVE